MSYRLVRSIVVACVLAGLTTPVWADDQDRRVLITNETNSEVVEFYGSRVSSQSWEEDMLKGGTLDSGEVGKFNFNDGTGACVFDFKAVLRDGRAIIAQKINVCQVSEHFIRE